jgi:stress response protein SCP2
MSMHPVTKGQNVGLPSTIKSLQVVPEWAGGQSAAQPDLMAVFLDGDRRVRGDADLVFYNQPESPGGSVRHVSKSSTSRVSGDALGINLDAVSADVETILFGRKHRARAAGNSRRSAAPDPRKTWSPLLLPVRSSCSGRPLRLYQ